MAYEPLIRAAIDSRASIRSAGVPYNHILAKIYVKPQGDKSAPIPLTNENKKFINTAVVFVTIPPEEPQSSLPVEREDHWKLWTYTIDNLLRNHIHAPRFKHPLNIEDMISRNLIYRKKDTGEYCYLVQDLDIIGGSADNRLLVSENDFQTMFMIVGTEDIISKGGNKCSLKPKSNKRNKKQNKRNSRRRYRSRKRNTRN